MVKGRSAKVGAMPPVYPQPEDLAPSQGLFEPQQDGPSSPPTTSLQRRSLLVMLSSTAIGIGNYAFSLVLVWLLPSSQFSKVASASALLLVVGVASSSVLPWVVARPVARLPYGSSERRQAVSFALCASVGIGLVIGVAVALLAAPYAPIGICLLLAMTSVALFVAGVGSGYLIGAQRFPLLVVVSMAEVLIKLGAGSSLAALGGGATGAFAGSALGALLWAAVSLWIIRHEVAWPRTRPPLELWHQLGGVGTTQVLVSVITTLDIIVGSIVIGARGGLATYQALLVFSRIPLFVSTAVSGVAYPKLVGHDSNDQQIVNDASTLYLLLSLPIVVCIATVPGPLLGLVLPHRYLHSLGLLVPMTVAGFAAGQLYVSTMFLQARLLFGAAIRVLAVAVPIITLTFVLFGTSIQHLAWAGATALSVLAAVLVFVTTDWFGPARLVTKTLYGVAALIVAEIGLRQLTPVVAAWIVAAILIGLLALRKARPKPRRPGPVRVLFLRGPRAASRQVAGGLRSLQEDMASSGFDVIVGFAVVPPGRSQSGGRPLRGAPGQVGRHGGRVREDRATRRLGYGWGAGGPVRALRAALLLHRSQPDLVVEELRPPYLMAAAPWWHRGAAVAIIQRTPTKALHLPSGDRASGRRKLRSYEHVVSALPRVAPDASAVAGSPRVALDASAAAAFAVDPGVTQSVARLGAFVAACRFACDQALVERFGTTLQLTPQHWESDHFVDSG